MIIIWKCLVAADHSSNETSTLMVLENGTFKCITKRLGRQRIYIFAVKAATVFRPATLLHPKDNRMRDPPLDFKSVIQFRETPPGSFGNAVIVALITAVIITYFTIFRPGIDPKLDVVQGNNNQDIPALILTLPAFLSAAIGRGMSSERLLNSSLAAFYGLWVVASTSLAAALLYIYSANRALPLEVHFSVNGGELRLNLVWVALSLFSIGVYLHLRKRMSEERKYYLRLLENAAIGKQVTEVYD